MVVNDGYRGLLRVTDDYRRLKKLTEIASHYVQINRLSEPPSISERKSDRK